MPEDMGNVFEDDGEDSSVEIEVLADGASPESDTDKVVMTKAELEALRNSGNSTAALTEHFSKFAAELQQQRSQNVNVPQTQHGETEEEFFKRFEEDLWKPGNAARTMNQYIERVVAPILNTRDSTIADLNKRLAMQDSGHKDIMQRYAGEVDAELAKIPLSRRGEAGAIQFATDQVRLLHMDEIVNERAAQLAQAAIAASQPAAVKDHGERGGVSAAGAAAPKKEYLSTTEVGRLARYGETVQSFKAMSEGQRNALLRRIRG